MRKKSRSAKSVEVEKSDTSTQVSVANEVRTQTESRADCECSKTSEEVKSIKTSYDYLIQEQDEIIKKFMMLEAHA